MWYKNVKRYLVAITFSVVLILLSGYSGNSIVKAGNSSYQSGAYQNYGYYHHRGYYYPHGFYFGWGY